MIERILFYRWDNVENTNYRYGKFERFWVPGRKRLTTSGSSTTVVTTISSSGVLKDVKVGDLVRMQRDVYSLTGRDIVKITAKASDNSMTVSTAVNWDNSAAGYAPWEYLIAEVPASGTAAGWFYVGDCAAKTIYPVITTVAAAGGIDLTVEGKTRNGDISTLYSVNYAAAADGIPIQIGSDALEFLRVGVKGGSGFAGTDDITITFEGEEKR